jgi:hypothetical protein
LPPFNNAADQFVDKDAAIIGWGRNMTIGKYKTDFHIEMKRLFQVKGDSMLSNILNRFITAKSLQACSHSIPSFSKLPSRSLAKKNAPRFGVRLPIPFSTSTFAQVLMEKTHAK